MLIIFDFIIILFNLLVKSLFHLFYYQKLTLVSLKS